MYCNSSWKNSTILRTSTGECTSNAELHGCGQGGDTTAPGSIVGAGSDVCGMPEVVVG